MILTLTEKEMQMASWHEGFEKCFAKHVEFSKTTGIFCNATWDNVLCWPPTRAGSTVQLPCPKIRGSNPNNYAIKFCSPSGQWSGQGAEPSKSPQGWTNYTGCFTSETRELFQQLFSGSPDDAQIKWEIARGTRILEMVGLSISFIALLVSIFIFAYFRCLKNDRTKIHANLFIAMLVQVGIRLILYIDQYIIRENTYFQNDQLNVSQLIGIDNTPILCELFYILLEYARTAMFLWMFIEGIHLHNLTAFHVLRNKTHFYMFHLLGWGLPIGMTSVWAIVTAFRFKSDLCWYGYNFSPYFWILEGPRLAVIIVNLFFLLNILRVLVTKMRKSTSNETLRIRKACRAAFLLLPLLGITNSLSMVQGPLDGPPIKFAFWSYGTHFLTSFQGFFIALIYCFLNGEVKTALNHHWYSYKCKDVSNYPRSGVFPNNLETRGNAMVPQQCEEQELKDLEEDLLANENGV